MENRRCFSLTRDELREVLERNNKQRFSFDESGSFNGFLFFCSTNEVWLVEHIPPPYLQIYPGEEA